MAEFSKLNAKVLLTKDLDQFNNRAFKYGDGIFESIRIRNAQGLFLEDHFQRMSAGLSKLKIENPFTFSSFSKEISEIIELNKIQKAGRIRLSVYRDAEGFYTPQGNKAAYFIEVVELPDNAYLLNDNGWKIDLCETVEIQPNDLSAIKTINALPYVLAGIYKREQQLDEVLLLNSKGNICEGSSSNVFLIADKSLLTPPISEGCVEGVMRKNILEIAKKLDLRIIENKVGIEEMQIAQEVFFTNAIQGIRWVAAFRKKRYFHKQVNLLLEELNKRF